MLANKKRGFGKGKLNGIGGKIENGENVEEALIRETKEEIGVILKQYEKVGLIDFYFEGKSEWNQKVHVFIATKWAGEPHESEEMSPLWVPINSLPVDMMWADDKYWLPIILAGKKIRGEFIFDANENIVKSQIEETSSLTN